MKSKLLIIGASGHGKVVADIAVRMNRWGKIAFLDDNKEINSILNFDVIGTSNDINKYVDEWDFFIAIGNNNIRKRLINKLDDLNASIPKLVHPKTIIDKNVKIDKGTVIMAGVIINSSSEIGKGCIVNTGSTIDHDNRIEDYIHISPGVNLAGNVTVGEKTWIGIGSTISNNINICSDCIVGAGSVVVKDIVKSGTYVGNPVRIIQK